MYSVSDEVLDHLQDRLGVCRSHEGYGPSYSANNSLGSLLLPGNSTTASDDRAIFIGFLSSALDIDRVVFGAEGTSSRSTTLGSIQTNAITGVPEPTTLVLLVAELAMISGLALRSQQTRDATARRYEGTHR